MKHIKKYPSKDELNEMFYYDNGFIFWKKKVSRVNTIGKKAGRLHIKGYVRVFMNGGDYLAHRIIYIMHNGDIPVNMLVDHKDEVKNNNKIDNLRLATNAQNKNNSNPSINNRSGCKGVRWRESMKRWHVTISVEGKNKYLGIFKEKGKAIEVYKQASLLHHKEFSVFAQLVN